ncbi:RNA-directed DNA polymerase, eukaryota, reverse transcriptase zinc-binding domain protein [Tanacetum coccineum]
MNLICSDMNKEVMDLVNEFQECVKGCENGLEMVVDNEFRLWASYARVLIEVDAFEGLIDCIDVCYKSLGRSMKLRVEYTWTPPICSYCKINDSKSSEAEWKSVAYKRVLRSAAGDSDQYGKKDGGYGRGYSVRGNASGNVRMAQRNVQQASGSKSVSSQYVPVDRKDSDEPDGFKSVVTEEDNDVANPFEKKSQSIKMQIQSSEQEIVNSNRYISSTANKKANALVESKMKETGLSRVLVMPGLYDEMYRNEATTIQELRTKKQFLEVDLFMCLQVPLNENVKDQWNDEMIEYYENLIDIMKNDEINGHYASGSTGGMGDEVAEDTSAHASFMTQNNASNLVDSSMAQMQTLLLLIINDIASKKPRPFRFQNFLAEKEGFLKIVRDNWNVPIDGYAMYALARRLRMMKKHMRRLNRRNGNVFSNVQKLKVELQRVQMDLNKDPYSTALREEEIIYTNAYKEALLDEERFLRQKSKIEWLKEGDQNNAYLHNSIKGRMSKSRIESVYDDSGNCFTGADVTVKFVEHFQGIFGVEGNTYPIDDPIDLFSKKISDSDSLDLAPGPDGFTSKFFKASWGVVGDDVCRAVKEFFASGKMLGELNTTIISLVPKSKNPRRASDYRPIACCGVVYKCVSKVITNRIKTVLNGLIDPNQGAFIGGRQISDNILLIQELMNGYTWKGKSRRCAFKVDIQKAYDTVSWDFLKMCLDYFGFHRKMVDWIMVCLSTTSFSININGDSCGFFKAKRGLRQGDPISPYLFTIVMEAFNLMVKRQISIDNRFMFHWGCKEMGITHLCFADDLMLLCHADMVSASILRRALDEFSLSSGLYPSIAKSTVYFGNVPNNVKCSILTMMPFEEGELPARYLGVPLVSRRLNKEDCRYLIERVQKRTSDWRNKCLSYAGRLQLIASILSSLQVYWASMFVLPIQVCESIDKLLKNFLWSAKNEYMGRNSVAWKDICLPKSQGGLGLKSLHEWNKALMTRHLWNVLSNKDYIWVRWVNLYWLKGKSLWSIVADNHTPWCWKQILSLRDLIRGFVRTKIGNGKTCNIWFDVWHDRGPLCSVIDQRAIVRTNLSLSAKVNDFVCNSVWTWPNGWLYEFGEVLNIHVPTFNNDLDDKVVWFNKKGKEKFFSMNEDWKGIRRNAPKVIWYKHVWFSLCVPRHSFILWMALKGKLKTQDNIQDMACPFCKSCKDSHSHLFFACSYSKRLWERLKVMACLDNVSNVWGELVSGIVNKAANDGIWNIIQRLVFGAAVYFIWQERNFRLFNKWERSGDMFSWRNIDSTGMWVCNKIFLRGVWDKKSDTVPLTDWGSLYSDCIICSMKAYGKLLIIMYSPALFFLAFLVDWSRHTLMIQKFAGFSSLYGFL